MWRAILLGKLAISIIASIIVGGICIAMAGKAELTVSQSVKWYALGGFFFVLACSFSIVVFLLFYKGRKPKLKE